MRVCGAVAKRNSVCSFSFGAVRAADCPCAFSCQKFYLKKMANLLGQTFQLIRRNGAGTIQLARQLEKIHLQQHQSAVSEPFVEYIENMP